MFVCACVCVCVCVGGGESNKQCLGNFFHFSFVNMGSLCVDENNVDPDQLASTVPLFPICRKYFCRV